MARSSRCSAAATLGSDKQAFKCGALASASPSAAAAAATTGAADRGVSGAARAMVQAGAKNCGIATTGHVTGTPRIACLNLGDRWAGSVCVYVLCVYVRLCVCVALATDTKTSCDLPSISFM